MKFILAPLFALLLLTSFQVNNKFCSKKCLLTSDTAIKYTPSGFYLATLDSSSAAAFQLIHTNEYYVLNAKEGISFRSVESAKTYYDFANKKYVLDFRFNEKGKSDLFEFTQKHEQGKIGLLVKGKLLIVATILVPIDNGAMSLMSNFSKSELDDLRDEISRSIKE